MVAQALPASSVITQKAPIQHYGRSDRGQTRVTPSPQ
jgi:hypothetical protein